MTERPDELEPLEGPPSLGVPTRLAPGPAVPHRVSVSEALSFAVDGPVAKRNLLVASLLLLVPIAGFLALQGYACETERRLVHKHPAPAPPLRLRDFPHYVARGGAAGLVEALGVGIIGALAASLVAIANASVITAGLAAGSLLVVLLVFVLAVALAITALGLVTVVFNTMLTRAELTQKLSDALSLKQAWREARPVRRLTFGAYLVFAPIAMLLTAMGTALCGLGLLPALVTVKLAGVHLRWQLYEHRVHRGGRALRALEPALLPSERALMPILPAPKEVAR